MAISSQLSAPLRLTLTLLSLAVWSCSNGSAGEDAPTDGTGQHIDDSSAGSGGAPGTDGAAEAGAGGMDGAPEPDVEGVGSATGAPDPDPGTGAKGSTDVPDMGEGGTSGDPDPEPEPPSAEFLRGQALVEQNECATCHQENFAGFTVFPNITPDEATGIGTWSDEQIISAIRDGVDADGESMCPTMMRYSFDQEQLSDIVAFLRGIPAVKNKITSECPGHGK
jgi:Cytochrome c